MSDGRHQLTLALRIDAPMQSWGIRSKFVERDTNAEPTKSGIVGLLGAALGKDREDNGWIEQVAALRMGVRVDREGSVERDYHTASDVPNTEGKEHQTVVSERFYLTDAVFLVLLEGEAGLVAELEQAVLAPRWPLFFGRRAFVPAQPLIEVRPERRRQYGTGVRSGGLERELETHPWLGQRQRARGSERWPETEPMLRTVLDTSVNDPLAELRHDHPVSFEHGARRFRQRAVRVGQVPMPAEREPVGGEPGDVSE